MLVLATEGNRAERRQERLEGVRINSSAKLHRGESPKPCLPTCCIANSPVLQGAAVGSLRLCCLPRHACGAKQATPRGRKQTQQNANLWAEGTVGPAQRHARALVWVLWPSLLVAALAQTQPTRTRRAPGQTEQAGRIRLPLPCLGREATAVGQAKEVEPVEVRISNATQRNATQHGFS